MSPGYTRLHATNIGTGAHEALEPVRSAAGEVGEVFRTFDRTAYIRLPETEAVIVVGTAGVRQGPLMITTDAGPGISLQETLKTGTSCSLLQHDPSTLSLGNSIVIEMPDDLAAPQPSEEQLHDLGSIDRSTAIWNRAQQVLDQIREDAGDGLGWIRLLEETIDHGTTNRVDRVATALARAAENGPPTASTDDIKWLIGRGPGATPSGDDILSGIVYTLIRTTEKPHRQHIQRTIKNALRDGAETTQMSAALIEQALKGRAPEPVEDCCTALLTPQSDPGMAVNAVTAIGHHSGDDILAGMLTTLLLIAPRYRP